MVGAVGVCVCVCVGGRGGGDDHIANNDHEMAIFLPLLIYKSLFWIQEWSFFYVIYPFFFRQNSSIFCIIYTFLFGYNIFEVHP